MGRKEWRATLELADRLIAIPSEEVAGQTLAAIAHHESKHYEQAVDAGRRILALDPELKRMPLPRTLFWTNLALDLMAMGRAEEARAYLESALAGSEDAGLMELLGLAYSHLGSTDEAERCWRQAERRDPDNADVCLDLGRLAMSRRQLGRGDRLLQAGGRAVGRRGRAALQPEPGVSDAGRPRRGGALSTAGRRSAAVPAAARRGDGRGRRSRRAVGEVELGDPGVAAMTIGKPRAIQIGLATGCLALVAAAAALLLPAASRPDPGLDGLEPMLAARRFDEAERRIGAYLRANPDDRAGQHADGAGRAGAGRSEAATGPRSPGADPGR